MLRGNAGKIAKSLTPSVRKVKRVVAAILAASPAFDDSLGFEFIHQSDHAAGHYAKVLRQSLLADPGIGRNLAEQPRIRRYQPNLCNSFGKAPRSVRAHLGQKEGGASRAPVRRRPFVLAHKTIVAFYNDSLYKRFTFVIDFETLEEIYGFGK